MSDKKTVFIVSDAVRWDYLNENDSPFILKLCKQGIYAKKLKPSLGFCERIEMFSGAKPDLTGCFTALTFDAQKSDFNKKLILPKYVLLNYLRKIRDNVATLSPILGDVVEHVIINRIFLKRLVGTSQPIYNIPMEFLREVTLTEDYHEMREKDALPVETIFDIMIQEKIDFLYDTFASLRLNAGHSDDARIKKFISLAKNQNCDLFLLYLGEGDAVGHSHGPSSKARRNMIRRLDNRINEIVTTFESNYDNVNFLIIGDHGMVDVRKHINAFDKILSVVNKNHLTILKDYKFFIDSTMVRIWFYNNKSKEVFKKLFNTDNDLTQNGQLIDEKNKCALHLPEDLTYYGDLIWLAHPGVVMFPDFFHKREKVKGMHGYDSSIDEQKGFAVLYSKDSHYNAVHTERDLIDICPTLCDLLSIRYPKSNTGKSLLQ
jgi:hypothetical protein